MTRDLLPMERPGGVTLLKLLAEFRSHLEVEWQPPDDLSSAAIGAIESCGVENMLPSRDRRRNLFSLVNSKLKLTRPIYQSALDCLAGNRISLNYHEKAKFQEFLDSAVEPGEINLWLESVCGQRLPISMISVPDESESRAALHEQLRTGKTKRCDARDASPAERGRELLRSLFGGFVFGSFQKVAMHKAINPDCATRYCPDFYGHLLEFHGELLHRESAMIYLKVDDTFRNGLSPSSLRSQLFGFLESSYRRLANHCFLGILVKPFREGNQDGQWSLYSDLVLFAEKHQRLQISAGYFDPESIRRTTESYVAGLDSDAAAFDQANLGFIYRDCFVLTHHSNVASHIETSSERPDILLLFEKNEADERVVPCPSCRSTNVAGNSYPSIGVRSWECTNPICPSRSTSDRGQRYSLSALIKQEAISSEEDKIPDSSLKAWRLDVVSGVDELKAIEMLIRHFTLHGDTAILVNGPSVPSPWMGRNIKPEEFVFEQQFQGKLEAFRELPMFRRYVVERKSKGQNDVVVSRFYVGNAELICGSCLDVLPTIPANSIDAAVTSPPYYNAKSYSQWPNIYCYLFYMFNSARAVYDALRPGGTYLFNIFDYFDNENTIASSAMGRKRMILGAYVVDLFRRVGFQLDGNIVWFKGEVEGKRNFNQGNRSPYYQFPLNSWEHIFVFTKPGAEAQRMSFPTVFQLKPVMKMVRGVNVLGHSAPFPVELPDLLVKQMSPSETVLDPFGGSMTTARAALRRGLRSICIELHHDYCCLGERLLSEQDGSMLALAFAEA